MSHQTGGSRQGRTVLLARRVLAWLVDSVRGAVPSARSDQHMAARLSAYEGLRSELLALRAQALALSAREPTLACEVATSDPSILTARPGREAEEGWHRVQVRSLASRHRIASGLWPEASARLGLSGEFVLNGCPVAVRAQDSPLSLRDAINRSRLSVDAMLYGSCPYRLVLTAHRAGPIGGITLVDANRVGILARLGFLRNSAAVKHALASGTRSDCFPSPERSIGSMLALHQAPRAAVRVDDQRLTIDLALDSLAHIADRITNSGGRTRARVCRARGGAAARYWLEIASPGEGPRLTDSGNVLHSLGLLAKPLAHELQEATDAEIVVDGTRFIRSSNAIARVIPGAVLTLVRPGGDREVLVCVRRGDHVMLRHAWQFVARFNEVLDTLSRACGVDGPTGEVGTLFGEPAAAGLASDLARLGDRAGPLAGLAEAGVSLGADGRLRLDQTAHRGALAASQGSWPPAAAQAAAYLADFVAELLDPLSGTVSLAQQALRKQVQAGDEATLRRPQRPSKQGPVTESGTIAAEGPRHRAVVRP